VIGCAAMAIAEKFLIGIIIFNKQGFPENMHGGYG
jgi:hypothetical protein